MHLGARQTAFKKKRQKIQKTAFKVKKRPYSHWYGNVNHYALFRLVSIEKVSKISLWYIKYISKLSVRYVYEDNHYFVTDCSKQMNENIKAKPERWFEKTERISFSFF